jgi:hypothetical protein
MSTDTILPALITWSCKRLLRALAQVNELIAAAGDYLPVDDWRIVHRDELLLALAQRRERRAA